MLCPLKLKYPQMIFVYMDDILITTTLDYDLHRRIVHKVLDTLKEHSFFLKPSKCAFKQQCIEYLGLVINGEKLRIESNKLKGIRDWPRKLTSVKQLHTTLGVLGYQRPFIPSFAQIAYPLT